MNQTSGLSALFCDVKAVIFDMDGTLLDSMSVWHDIDVEFLSSRHLPMRPDLQKQIEGISMVQVAQWFKKEFDLPEDIPEIMDIWNRMAEEAYRTKIPLKEGAEDFIEALDQAGIRMAIATSNSGVLVRAAVEQHAVLSKIHAFATSDEVTVGKPAPDVYLYAAKELGVSPEHCLVMEDLPAGIASAKNAGMRVCAVEDSYSAGIRAQKEAEAHGFAEDFNQLLQAFLDYKNSVTE